MTENWQAEKRIVFCGGWSNVPALSLLRIIRKAPTGSRMSTFASRKV